MTEYVDDELPLPPFADMFGEGLVSSKKKAKKLRESNQADETTGRWTPEEHRLFLEGIMLYGKDWKKMQPLIKSRSLVQIRTHAQKVFKKIGLKKALLMGTGKRAKVTGGNAVSTGGIQGEAEDFDGDDTAVGAEELQLLQQMSQQMMQEEEEENQRRQRQHVQTSSSSNINTNSSSQQTSQNQAGQHQHQHQAPIQQQHHYTTSTDKSHIDRTTNSGTDFPSSSSAAAGTSAAYGASTGHSVGETGIDIRGIEPNQSLLPEHAFHQSYSAAFNAFSTNPEYATAAQGAFGNGGNDQGLNVMLQYASNSIDQDSFSVHQQ